MKYKNFIRKALIYSGNPMKQLFFFLLLFSCVSTSAQVFQAVVATDGSGTYTTIQAALNACPDNVRSIVFVKNGIYNEQVTVGSSTVASAKLISLIGESANGVIITHSQSRAASGSPTFEDVCTVKIYAKDFYAENLTVQNTAGNTGMAEAMYTAGDRQTFKNCRFLGYQDTYRSRKATRGYFENCWLEGATDFIYAGGINIFDNCTINSVSGGCATAPEDADVSISKTATVCGKFIRVGFFFRNCNLTANSNVAAGACYLGRPWNTTSGSIYLNCKLGSHINAAGWQAWGGNETTASFAEYNSMDVNGNPVDVSGRISWSFQLPKADVDNLMTTTHIFSLENGTTVYNPIPLCVAPASPVIISLAPSSITWNKVDSISGYVVLKDGNYLTAVTDTTYTDKSGISGVYSVKSIGLFGQLSKASSIPTSVENPVETTVTATMVNKIIYLHQTASIQLYSTTGKIMGSSENCDTYSVKDFSKGIYLLRIKDSNGRIRTQKLIF